MANSPLWKVYDSTGEYRAACKDVVHALVLCEFIGPSSTIRFDHKTICWRQDAIPTDSYDQSFTLVDAALRDDDDGNRIREMLKARTVPSFTSLGAFYNWLKGGLKR